MNFNPYQSPMYEPIYRIYYLGKSNKDFTHNKVYKCFGSYTASSDEETLNSKNYVNLTVYGNKGNMILFNDDYYEYVENNFKFITMDEYNQYIRKTKLNKISNKYTK